MSLIETAHQIFVQEVARVMLNQPKDKLLNTPVEVTREKAMQNTFKRLRTLLFP